MTRRVPSYNRKQISSVKLSHIKKLLETDIDDAEFRELLSYIVYDGIAYNTIQDVETEERLRGL